jgi:serine phosphatase RsbU (regulator of sigma subunit)/anti-sigma regulatory factor (Ser/Thr protein kinase)
VPKPVNINLLSAKISVFARIQEMQFRIASDASKLNAYYRSNEAEQALAQHVLNSLAAQATSDEAGIRQWIKPAENFSGDVITVARAPTGVHHIMLADSTGHGLAAAISCLPAVLGFYAMTQKGFGIGVIAREVNAQLHRALPIGRFVAATIAAVDYKERIVAIWNGGLPDGLLVGADGSLLRRFPSQHPPLGILSPDDFDPSLALYRWQDPATLILYSDGLTEARSATGEAFGERSLLHALAVNGTNDKFDAICAALSQHVSKVANHDDVSLVVVPCEELLVVAEPQVSKPRSHLELANWEIKLSFGPRQLREDNCMPALLGWLHQIELAEKQFGEVLLVMTELFNNALDHGLLGLPSATKSEADGFLRYMELRQERLSALETGSVEIGMVYQADTLRAILRLWVRDSGPGFDLSGLSAQGGCRDQTHAHGRGIALVYSICDKVTYFGNGNYVEVEYALS